MAISEEQSGTAVVAYFDSAASAARAVDALEDAGFSREQVGAAFYRDVSQPVARGSENQASGESEEDELGGGLNEGFENDEGLNRRETPTSFGGPTSDDASVQPNVIGTGYGTGKSGPSRPVSSLESKPLASSLPSELKSTLPHDSDLESGERTRSAGYAEDVADDEARPTSESQNFGSGQGHLILGGESQRVGYSHSAFESSFSGYGLKQDRARYLSHRLGHQGAVVTVHASARNEEAEGILKANGGAVDFSDTQELPDYAREGEIEMFGTMARDYSSEPASR